MPVGWKKKLIEVVIEWAVKSTKTKIDADREVNKAKMDANAEKIINNLQNNVKKD